MAHQAYLTGDYGRCIGMAENALGMKQARYPISEMFLHLVAAMGWMSKRQPEKAECHFMEAWSIAQADDLIETIGDTTVFFRVCLKRASKKITRTNLHG